MACRGALAGASAAAGQAGSVRTPSSQVSTATLEVPRLGRSAQRGASAAPLSSGAYLQRKMQLAQRVTRVAAAAPGSPQPHKPYLGPFIRKAQQQPVAAAVSSSSSSSSASSFSAGSISISSGLGSKGLLAQLRAQQPQQQPQRAAASQQPQAPQAPQPLFAAPADPLGGTVQSYEDEYVLPGWGVELPLEVQAERLRQVLAAVAAAPAAEDKVRVRGLGVGVGSLGRGRRWICGSCGLRTA